METYGGQIIYYGHSLVFKNIELCDRMWSKVYDQQFILLQVYSHSHLLITQLRLYFKSSVKTEKYHGSFALEHT